MIVKSPGWGGERDPGGSPHLAPAQNSRTTLQGPPGWETRGRSRNWHQALRILKCCDARLIRYFRRAFREFPE